MLPHPPKRPRNQRGFLLAFGKDKIFALNKDFQVGHVNFPEGTRGDDPDSEQLLPADRPQPADVCPEYPLR